MNIMEQMRTYTPPRYKELNRDELENVIRYHERYGTLRTVSHFDLSIQQLRMILKDAGKA